MAEVEVKTFKRSPPLVQKICRRLVLNKLAALKVGTLEIEDAHERASFGDANGQIKGMIRVDDLSFYTRVVTGGAIGAAEAYMDGLWDSPDLPKLIQVFALNQFVGDDFEAAWVRVLNPLRGLQHWFNRNTQKHAKRNIAAHYDLGNDFYALFLDSSMMYSSAIYPNEQTSLSQASQYKLKRVCEKLALESHHHLIEIGSGWGGMAIYAAQHYGCRVTTTTLSQAQYEITCQRVEQAGLSDKITVLKKDYRQLTGQFDRLVSIEMIEAVGAEYYQAYFKQCSKLLKPDGKLVIQAITIKDQRYRYYLNHVDFIQKYIFPGGSLPSIQVLCNHFADNSDLLVTALEDIGLHYAKTIADWRRAFMTNLEAIQTQGFDQRFIKMWLFYFAYCEGGFRERLISTVQIVAEKPAFRPLNPIR